ncbi:hypothetical protein Tco_0439683, partial [Tanacetum coccineum]
AVIEKTNTNPATEAKDVDIRSALGLGTQRSSESELAAFYAGFHVPDVNRFFNMNLPWRWKKLMYGFFYNALKRIRVVGYVRINNVLPSEAEGAS